MSSASTISCCNRNGSLVGRPSIPGSGRWHSAHIDVVDELVLHKNGWSINKNYLHTVLNNMTLLCTKYYQNWSMSVEDIANQSSVFFWAWLKRPIIGVYDYQGSTDTLVRRGGITNYHLIAYSFSNISVKNYQNRLRCIEVIAWNLIVVFWDTAVYMLHAHSFKRCCIMRYKSSSSSSHFISS